MQVAKWGNALAVIRQPRADEVLEALGRFRGRLPAADRLSRDAAHEH